jgi:hypothetical protein
MSFNQYSDHFIRFKGINDNIHYSVLDKDGKTFFFLQNYDNYSVELLFDFGCKNKMMLHPDTVIGNQIHYWERDKTIGFHVSIEGEAKGYWKFTYNEEGTLIGRNW